jgi:outer membrane receptor protein involved in Fe transport
MPAIAARATWTWTCAPPKAAGTYPRACARSYSPAACNPRFAPHLAGSLRLDHQLKLRASGGYGFRLPTYTDLYYSDPATIGNPKLKPESAWSGEAGADWVPSSRFSLSATGFYNRQHDTIDYVRAASLA